MKVFVLRLFVNIRAPNVCLFNDHNFCPLTSVTDQTCIPVAQKDTRWPHFPLSCKKDCVCMCVCGVVLSKDSILTQWPVCLSSHCSKRTMPHFRLFFYA